MACPVKAIPISQRASPPSPPLLYGHNLLDTNVKINIMLITAVLYVAIAVIFRIGLARFFSLPPIKMMHMTLHCTRLMYGFAVIAAGIDTVFLSSDVYEDVVNGTSVASVLITVSTVSHTLIDTVTYFLTGWLSGKMMNSLPGLIHHFVMLPLYIFSTITDTGYFFTSAFLLVEVGCLGMPANVSAGTAFGRSSLGKINNMIALHLFHFRNFIEVYLWLVIYRNWDQIVKEMPVSVTVSLFIMLGVISILLTPLWAYFLTRKIILGNWTESPGDSKTESSKGLKNRYELG